MEAVLEEDILVDFDSMDDLDEENFLEEEESLAVHSMEAFFKDRKFHCGGPIPKNSLFSRENIELVRDSEFCKGVDAIFYIINAKENLSINEVNDVQFMLELLAEVKKFRILKRFQVGIVLLYLKYCKGYKLPRNLSNAIRY